MRFHIGRKLHPYGDLQAESIKSDVTGWSDKSCCRLLWLCNDPFCSVLFVDLQHLCFISSVLVQETGPDWFYTISLYRQGLISYPGRKNASELILLLTSFSSFSLCYLCCTVAFERVWNPSYSGIKMSTSGYVGIQKHPVLIHGRVVNFAWSHFFKNPRPVYTRIDMKNGKKLAC